jgi:membrane protease YdiL (CAAX protease family)
LPWTLYAIAAGFFFGVLYDRGGLAPVMLAHVVVNFCGFARTGRRDRDELFLR